MQAEARLAARRQARCEARNIRMRELEKKARDDEETTGQTTPVNNIHTGRNLLYFSWFSSFLKISEPRYF